MVASQRGTFVFKIDPKLLQSRPPRLVLAGTLDALGKRVQTHDLDANVVVDILSEKQLLPYVIGSIKNLHIVSLGQVTNASKIGDIIASDESIKGSYELCMTFLRFVLTIIKSDSYVDKSHTMLASLTYIANDIYTNHTIWTYKDPNDMQEILNLCTEIFHHTLVSRTNFTAGSRKQVERSSQEEPLSELEIVCAINLSLNQAHKQLLAVMVDGKQLINDVISRPDFDGEQTIKTEPIVQRVRQSLDIFCRLLERSGSIKNYYESQNITSEQNLDSSTTNYSSAPMTIIERALFDTSMRPTLLQRLFDYVYQAKDPVTACKVIQIIERVAEKFPMSLMASLDSGAEKVCTFLKDCLGGKSNDIDMKTSIVDLLTTCVRHQPGLIESFLSHERDKSDKTSESSSLRALLDLVKECLENQNDAHRKLHTYVMRFFLTFWQKCHSVIEQFAKNDEFWDLITRPLVKFLDRTSTTTTDDPYRHSQVLEDKLVAYVLMIYAQELFNLNARPSQQRQINEKLKERIADLANRNLVIQHSTYVVNRFRRISTNMDRSEDYTLILSAWRDFLASYTKYKPFDLNKSVKNQLILDIMACLAVELKLGEKLGKERVVTLGELLLIPWFNWRDDITASDAIFESVHELLYLVDASKQYLPFSFLSIFQAIVNMYTMHARDHLLNATRTFDLLVPSLELMHFSLKILEAAIVRRDSNKDAHWSNLTNILSTSGKPNLETRLCYASITSLRLIIDVARTQIDLWWPYFQRNLKLDSLIQYANMLIERQANADVSLALVELLAHVCMLSQTTYYLNKSKLLPLLDNFLAKEDGDHPGWTMDAVKQMQQIKKIISNSPGVKPDQSYATASE